MKKLLLFLVLGTLLLSGCSEENPTVRKAFSKYKHKDGVESISIPGFVIRWAASLGELEESERQLLKSIDKVRVLDVENKKLNSKINLNREFSSLFRADKRFEELFVSHDKNNDVAIYGKMEGGNLIKELVVLAGGDENAIVYIKGNIDPGLFNGKIDLSNPGRFLDMVK